MALEVPASERFCLHPFPLPLLRLKLLTPEKLLESGFQHFLAEIAKVEFSGLIQDLNR
jgi:hypothetical protein